MTKPNAAYLRKQLEEIATLDRRKVDSQYQIANLLTAIRDHKLWELDGHRSFAHMVSSELEFAPSTAGKYCKFYELVTRLGYKREETLKLMQRFGRNRLMQVLEGSGKKLSIRAIETRLKSGEHERSQLFHFNLSDEKVAAGITQTLSQFGLTTHKSGMRVNLTSAFVALVEDHKRLTKELAKTKAAPKRKLKVAS